MAEYSPTRIKNLFLRQSYIDTWNDYQKVIKSGAGGWDYVILTASNEEQAKGYRLEIEYRRREGRLPAGCRYVVLPDPEGRRVGSGGATFHVLRYLAEQIGGRAETCIKNKKILVIHSGGDSKRVPQYSVCGKLFSPVPRQLPDGNLSTLFDEFMISMTTVAGRIKEGMLVLSGDVLLLFNPLQLDFQFKGAAAISIKEHVSTGKDHGVFLRNDAGMVEQFLHKKTEEQLRGAGAVNEQGCVDLDTGAVLLDCELLRALFGLICRDGRIDEEKYAEFVNEQARISFYGDFLYPLACGASLKDYDEQAPEGSFSQELTDCRGKIWKAISEFSMKVICLSPAEFIHFGTTGELLELLTERIDDYEFLGWERIVCSNRQKGEFAARNSFICQGAVVEKNAYLENCYIGDDVVVKESAILSNITLHHIQIPAHTAVHAVKQQDGRFVVRVYGILDNPKGTYEENTSFLSGWLKDTLDFYGVPAEQVWEGDSHSLWEARLYPLADTVQEGAEASLLLARMVSGEASRAEAAQWMKKERVSLRDSFNQAAVEEVLPFQEKLKRQILVDQFVGKLEKGIWYQEALKVFGSMPIEGKLKKELLERAKHSDYGTAMRIYYALGMEDECFDNIRRQVFESMKEHSDLKEAVRIREDEVRIALPLRVNWGGGWTDTPPYCNEQGGMVLNAAITLNGILPVQVVIKRLDQLQIEFESSDLGVSTVIHELARVQDCMDPYDFFALHKAALIACGLIPGAYEDGAADRSLEEILNELGGGIYLSTKVEGVPKGSGLGTSSILAGACARAIASFVGKKLNDSVLFDQVLYMEQIMSTGGGWQDQVGGMVPGIKMITSKPGVHQILHVEPVRISDRTKEELNSRFAVIYTGQRRLARNLLREVVGNYIGGRTASVEALSKMKETALQMQKALLEGDVDRLALLFNRHWELSLQLDGGATNLCIDQIFMTIEDLIDGKFIAGAGGGGFLQVIMKKGVTKDQLDERLKEVFQGTGVAVWNSELYYR